MKDISDKPAADSSSTEATPIWRPSERLWPYVDVSEQPTDEEIAALNADLQEALLGRARRPFSITLVFPPFDAPDYEDAVAQARASAEYRETGEGATFRHRARFEPGDALRLRDLFHIVGRFDGCQVLVDDKPVPYARELWLPLIWFLIHARA